MSKSNLIVCAKPVSVSSQYEDYDFNKMSFMGSGEFTGIYYDSSKEDGQDKGNNLGCRGVYVIGVYSATTGANSILNKEVRLYLSDKQLSELPKEDELGHYTWTNSENIELTSLIRVVNNKTTTFDNSFYTDKANLVSKLTEDFAKPDIKNIKFSYTNNAHYTDSLQFVSFDAEYCCATFKWITNASNTSFNSIFANDPGSYDTEKNTPYSLRTYDTALYTYDDLDFGLCEIYPTCFAVGTGNTAAGDGAIATGLASKAMGAFSAAFNRSSQARGYSAFAAGHKSKALIEKSVALGNSCETLGISSFAAGYQSIANKDYSVALGCQCITGNNATGAFAAGYQSKANNNYSVALGVVCETLGPSSFAAGYKSKVKANANYSVALGNNCIAKAANSFAMGYQCITNNAYSVALGNNCITGAGSQCVVGKYNCKNSTAVFAVGYGNSEDVTVESTGKKYKKINGKNIFEVVTDGQIVVPIQGATDRFASIRVVLNKDTNNIELICSEVDVVKDPRTGIIWLDSDGNEVADPTK